MKEIYKLVDENSELFISELGQFIRKPGISTEKIGIEETVGWLLERALWAQRQNKTQTQFRVLYLDKESPVTHIFALGKCF